MVLSPMGRLGRDPFAEMRRMQMEMNRVFDQLWSRFDEPFRPVNGFGVPTPRAEVAETDAHVEVSVELPGMNANDVDMSLAGDVLTIRGEKKDEREEKRQGYYLSERSYGSFYRAIPLPPGVATEDVKAELRNGVLTVRLPKTEDAQANVKRIEVKAAA